MISINVKIQTKDGPEDLNELIGALVLQLRVLIIFALILFMLLSPGLLCSKFYLLYF